MGGVALTQSSGAGTPESLPAGSSDITLAEGALLGDANSGVGESGIDLTLGKSLSEKAPITGSFTRPFADSLGIVVEGFSYAVPLKGSGATATPADAEYRPTADGVSTDAFLRACGLTGAAWGSGDGWEYTPASTEVMTAGVYYGIDGSDDLGYVRLSDVSASTLTFQFTPGEIATMTADFAGSFEDEGTVNHTSDPFDYGTQATLSAPQVASVAFTWDVARGFGFSSLQIVLDNETEEIAASNSASGKSKRQTGRTITVSATFDADSVDTEQEITQLQNTVIGSADAMSFTVGTAAGASDTINAYTISLPTPEPDQMQFAKMAASQAYTMRFKARAASTNGEFVFRYI